MGSHDHHDVRPELARGGLRNAASSLNPERTLAAYDGAEIVGERAVGLLEDTVPAEAAERSAIRYRS